MNGHYLTKGVVYDITYQPLTMWPRHPFPGSLMAIRTLTHDTNSAHDEEGGFGAGLMVVMVPMQLERSAPGVNV